MKNNTAEAVTIHVKLCRENLVKALWRKKTPQGCILNPVALANYRKKVSDKTSAYRKENADAMKEALEMGKRLIVGRFDRSSPL